MMLQRLQQVHGALHVDSHGDLGLAVRDAVDGLSGEVVQVVGQDVADDSHHTIAVGDVTLHQLEAMQHTRQCRQITAGPHQPVHHIAGTRREELSRHVTTDQTGNARDEKHDAWH